MSMTSKIEIYSIILALISALVFLVVREFLRRVEKKRHERIAGKQEIQACVSTTSPLRNPFKEAHATATKSIEGRFTIIRRLLAGIFVSVLIIIIALPFLGALPATVISLMVAAISVFIGIATKPFLENFIAGVVLTFSRPFRVGDTVYIDQEYYGTVEDITMTYTIIKIWDWRRYVVPNSLMMTKDFLNLTLKDKWIWSYVEFWVAPDADIVKVKEVAINAAKVSDAFNSSGHEEPGFWVMGMEEKAMRCWVAAWTDSPAAAWQFTSDVRFELIRQLQILKVSPHRFSLDVNNISGLGLNE